MLTSVRGTYRRGHIELDEATSAPEDAPVIVTFLHEAGDLKSRGISEEKRLNSARRLQLSRIGTRPK